ncbi:MAG: site-2 protease family protein [Planctomycetota bacterium]
MENIIWFPLYFIILIFSMIIHECAHGWMAYRLGDPTAYYQGRITLNPFKHIDPMMTIIVPLLTFFGSGGGFIFGGAKPVPINPYNFRNTEKGMLLSSLAGPVSNLILALLGFGSFVLIAKSGLLTNSSILQFNRLIFYILITVNMTLALFNLIPIPPLDGSRILRYFLPWHMKESLDRLEFSGFGFIVIVLLLWVGGFNFINIILRQIHLFLQNII